MKDRYFCEVVVENDDIIKFRMVDANFLDEAVDILKEQYSNIKEWVITDMHTRIRYHS